MRYPSQRTPPSRRFLIVTFGLCAFVPIVVWLRRPTPPHVRPPAKPYHFPTQELAELDRAIQARFAIVPDSDFGLGRVGARHGYFYPASPSEKTAVQNLQRARQEVAFYVVGRNTILKHRNARNFAPVQGPVYITPHTPVQVAPQVTMYTQARFLSTGGVAQDAPTDHELIGLSRRVFDDDSLRNGTDARLGNWQVVARPVLATSPQCVDCHSRMMVFKPEVNHQPAIWQKSYWDRSTSQDRISLGDTVGVALYCYRSDRYRLAHHIQIKQLSSEDTLAQPDQ